RNRVVAPAWAWRSLRRSFTRATDTSPSGPSAAAARASRCTGRSSITEPRSRGAENRGVCLPLLLTLLSLGVPLALFSSPFTLLSFSPAPLLLGSSASRLGDRRAADWTALHLCPILGQPLRCSLRKGDALSISGTVNHQSRSPALPRKTSRRETYTDDGPRA